MPTMKLQITIYRDKFQLRDVNDKLSSKLELYLYDFKL